MDRARIAAVERVVAAHLGHLDRERQRVVGILEEPVVVDHDRVVEEPRRPGRKPEGAFVAYEMRLVPPARELLAERRGEDAASPHGGVAGYADPKRARGSHVRNGSPTA
jgi:hypothetical protein